MAQFLSRRLDSNTELSSHGIRLCQARAEIGKTLIYREVRLKYHKE